MVIWYVIELSQLPLEQPAGSCGRIRGLFGLPAIQTTPWRLFLVADHGAMHRMVGSGASMAKAAMQSSQL